MFAAVWKNSPFSSSLGPDAIIPPGKGVLLFLTEGHARAA